MKETKNSFNLFFYIKALYTKDLSKINTKNIELWQIMAILKWLSYNIGTIEHIKKTVGYIFLLEPEILFNMLYLVIPKEDRVPFIHKIEKEESTKINLYIEIQKFLEWSDKELLNNKSLLDKFILPNEKYWRQEFAIEK